MLSQPYLEKEDKKSNVYLGVYSELRVDLFKFLYKELNGLAKQYNDGVTEKYVELFVNDLLEIVDKENKRVAEKAKQDAIHYINEKENGI